jgi:hypothetical protein
MTPGIDHGDFENELRDLFREKAGEAPLASPTLPTSAPQRVLRRGRLHQAGTVLGSAVVVVALIVGSVAGLTRILGEGERDGVGGGDYEVFQRTATVEAFTVTSPSDWYLVNQWPLSMLIAVEGSGGSASACFTVPGDEVQECEDTPGEVTSSPLPVPQGLPMLQLSNVDLGSAANACAGGLPGDAVVLYVALDYDAAIAGIADPSIPEFPPGTGLPPEGGGPCGPGRYAYFTVNGERFFSWIGVGSGASAEDRETVETSYEMMSAIPGWTPTPPNETTPAYVIAGGEYGPGDDWRIELRPTGDALQVSLESGPAPVMLLTDGSAASVSWTGTDPVFGAVSKSATGVEFQPSNAGDPIPGTIVPLPPSLPFDLDLFFIEGTGGLAGEVFAPGIDEPTSTPSPTPSVEPRADVVILSGGNDNHTWIVRFDGSFDDGNACIRVRLDTERSDPLCPGASAILTSFAGQRPSMHGWLTSYYLLAGSVPLEVADIRFVDTDGSARIRELQCTTGPIGWADKKVCAIRLPVEGSGTMEYLDGDGNVLFEDGMEWFVAQGEPVSPTPVDPVHGGTYWAVYPWLGPAGDPEANAVVGQLFDEFGIQAIQGEVGCDQGAAEALGTDAVWRVAVYFDTDTEANAFAMQAGLLDHTRRVIAHVTTYCLD